MLLHDGEIEKEGAGNAWEKKQMAGKLKSADGGHHRHHHHKATRPEESPKSQGPEAKGLCAGCKGVEIEDVCAASKQAECWQPKAYGQRGCRIGLRPDAKKVGGRRCLVSLPGWRM